MVRGYCLPSALDNGQQRAPGVIRLLTSRTDWDSDKTYKQMVILINFSDVKFATANPNPREHYDSLFNVRGYEERRGAGSVADYFREQSGGHFNLSFDVYGPVEVSSKARQDGATKNTRNYGVSALREAATIVVNDNPDVDYSVYDWNGDQYIDQVIYVYAGYGGNQGSEDSYGHIWPNTYSFTQLRIGDTPYYISEYTCSAERWVVSNGKYRSCGIGTICHEFSHCLGLPDLYDTSSGNPVMDEWTLMDGGNFTNMGSCPPNYTPLEKKLLGWIDYEELTEPAYISDLEPGKVYQIKTSTDNDYYLLENRQQTGWDNAAPGKGLLIYHVSYNANSWSGNTVNNGAKHLYDIIHADGKDYDAWNKIIGDNNNPYDQSSWCNSKILSTSPFPYQDSESETVADSFTEVDGKPVTNIKMTDDGLISFSFRSADAPDAIRSHVADGRTRQLYDLSGHRVETPQTGHIYIRKLDDGSVRKIICK